MLVGKALGVKWKAADAPEEILEPAEGPSIAELAAAAPAPLAGGDTMAASRAIIEAMAPKGDLQPA